MSESTTFTSGYDDEDRLVNWERSDTALDQSWNLSLVGDWNSITENTVAQSRTHGDTHEILTAGGSAVSHDAKGNQTLIPATLGSSALALNWDFENKLSTADVGNDSSVDVTYKFDALGRRVYRDDGTSAIVYVQSGQQTIADYGSGVAAATPMYRYVWASYIDEPVVRVDSSDATLYYHRNQQYSIIALTDGVGAISERYAYTAYGEPVFMDGAGTVLSVSAEGNRYTYTGREWDEKLALYHYRARMYDSVTGRFCSRDPIGYVDGANLYQNYFGLAKLDPSGKRHLTSPATPEKCAEAVFLMQLYSEVFQLASHDKVLWNHYQMGSGTPLTLSMDAFDPSGDHRSDLAMRLFEALPGKPVTAAGVGCDSRVFLGANTKSGGYYNGDTLMVSSYSLTGTSNFWLRKSCWLCFKTCFIDYTITYSANDIADFNPGDTFGFTLQGIEYLIDDQLIIDCNIGKKFPINATATESGTWVTDCDSI